MTTNDTTAAAVARNYPLPALDSDPRFTFGLLHDVAKAIEAHGYPPLTGRDVVELQVALFGLLYTTHSAPDLTGGPVHAYPSLDERSNRSDPQPRCGAASGRMALFAADVTCPPCLALMAKQNSGAEGDAPEFCTRPGGAMPSAEGCQCPGCVSYLRALAELAAREMVHHTVRGSFAATCGSPTGRWTTDPAAVTCPACPDALAGTAAAR